VACKGNLNIRIHRDITGEMWFGVLSASGFMSDLPHGCGLVSNGG
jgi:hypothetical protein